MRRVLLFAYFYPPLAGGGVHRVLSFTRHLPAHGWACTVVCAGERDYWVRDDSLVAVVPGETEVLRVPGGSGLSAWLKLRRDDAQGRRSDRAFRPLRALVDWFLLPDSYAGWAGRARATVEARIARGDIDVLLSSSPPDSVHLAAREAARATGVTWVADFRDPWVGLQFRTPPTPWHAAAQRAMEARVLTGASLVLAASRTHAEALGARTEARPRAVLHLPNGFEPAPPGPPGTVAADRDHFRVVFTGSLSLMDELGTLIDAVAALLARDPGARAVLRVDLLGPYDREWETRARARGLDGVLRFAGARAHAESRAAQRAAELLLLWRPRGEGYRTMVPGKLYEYLASGRPVLALLPEGDEAAVLVRRAGGAVIAPGAAQTLERELAGRLARWRAGARAADAVPDWLGGHTREHLAGTLARALDGLVAGARS
jgi:glycosyltransferase involved in cell wall biosynthesis